MSNKLTQLQAFDAMIRFLEMYYERTSSHDIGALLSDLQILPDGKTADPASWHDWTKAVTKALQKQ